MDVNGLPMWQYSGRRAFGLAADAQPPNAAVDLHFKDEAGHLQLARQQPVPALAEDQTFARSAVAAPSPVADGLGGFAWWDFAQGKFKASGFAPGSVDLPLPLPEPASLQAPEDIALGADDVLYAARDGAVVMRDIRDRWPPAQARKSGFRAHLLAPAPGGGVWAFDRVGRSLARLSGYPLRFGGLRDTDPNRFEPVEPNRDPPRLRALRGARLPDAFEAVAMAASEGGRLAILAWELGDDAAIFTLEGGRLVFRMGLAGLRFPFSIAWNGEDQVAVLATDGAGLASQAFVYPMDLPPTGRSLPPDGRVHPMIAARVSRFCNALSPVPLYLVREPGGDGPVSARPLRALSGGLYARQGSTLVGPIDSGQAGCVWHRLYAEAALPGKGAIDIDAFATDAPGAPALPGEEGAGRWAPHRISASPSPDAPPDLPRASWCREASEIPFGAAQLSCPARPGSAGLFTLLLQDSGRKVRRLSGRYLWLRVTLAGNGQGSPELAAIRVYGNRFSYRDRYLPAFYREPLGGPDAAAEGAATPHDFMDRMLGLFEGVLTETEGKIASSWLLTDPAAAPAEALPWLGSWIGVPGRDGANIQHYRQSLLAAPYTAALNGTLGGLLGALELATGGLFVGGGRLDPGRPAPPPGSPALARLGDLSLRALMLSMQSGGECAMLTGGAVTRGDIVVVEGFRLRRTFATILGADLADEEDPLTLGMAQSGNSFVGDTLILGDEARAELLALYRSEVDDSRGDSAAVEQFYARLAHRVLVLVRGIDDSAEIRRLTEIVEEAVPAHVEARVHTARDPLIVGAASLVGIDTYLAEGMPFERVRLGRSILGEGDFVAGSGHLDPRADAPASIPPVAVARGPGEVWTGSGFTLSAAGSRAAPGRRINRYIWSWE
jgi:phage tail-like protein